MRRARPYLGLVLFAVVALAACVPATPPPSGAAPLPGNCQPRGAFGTSVLCTFGFTGTAQAFVVPAGVHSVTIDTWGAQGRGEPIPQPNGGTVEGGGEGGHARGTFTVARGESLAVFV